MTNMFASIHLPKDLHQVQCSVLSVVKPTCSEAAEFEGGLPFEGTTAAAAASKDHTYV